ncbi:pickpocket protein 19-like [Plodia interpunctella]|uniref:pickpocket protein 19-like n=1 Tax=Plodia interpunctella TaxID=58824 RepID=UPI002368A172|nr:pickpocket protein 19-like [Plodia interpunctella]
MMGSKEAPKKYFDIWWAGIKRLPETTSIHGFRFIADSKRHWTERIFWLAFVALSWYGSSLLIQAQYKAYQNYPISFVVETTYKDWNTDFPSVAVCENDNTKRIEEISDKLWGEDHDFNMEEVLKEIAFFKGITYYTSEFCGLENPLSDCVKGNLSQYANMVGNEVIYVQVRSSCEDTFANCSWNGESFPCCKYFRPMETELGTCFVINSIQGRYVLVIIYINIPFPSCLNIYFFIFCSVLSSNILKTFHFRDKHVPKLPMVSNKTTGPGAINFLVLVTANVYILNEEEVPSLTTLGSDVLTVGPEVTHKRYITIRNIENDREARMISPAKRKCRYTDENFLDVYRHYSYTACTVQCRKDAQLRLCNCTNYFMPNVPDHLKCDVSGIICLNDHVNVLSVSRIIESRQNIFSGFTRFLSSLFSQVLRAEWSSRTGLYCNCLPSCTEAEISIVKDFKATTSEPYANVQIALAMLPSEKYRRNVVRGVLDLVVSTGGTGGLFLGASILSFVELLYILLIRPFCDIYSKRDDDPWYRKYGTRKLEDNKFIPNPVWSYETVKNDKDIKRRIQDMQQTAENPN